MVVLIVQNEYSSRLAGLGKRKPISELSEKRITVVVRKNLRSEYGKSDVIVSCKVFFLDGTWNSKCTINDVEYNYKIKK